MLWIAWLISWIINVFSPLIISFSLITTPSHIPYSFCSSPIIILITAKRICVLSGWSGSVLSGLQRGFIGFLYSWLLFSLSSDHFFSPFIISYFSSLQTPHISQDPVSPPFSLINSKTICMDWIAWVWYILSQIYCSTYVRVRTLTWTKWIWDMWGGCN